MRLPSSVLVLSLLVSCGAAEPENCSVTENADGSATITCPDGSTATVTDGSDGSNGANGADGLDGTDGTDGLNGEKGAAGEDGEDGLNALVRLEEEAPGENCEFGGTAIMVGLDEDGDGTLDASEILTTEYVCDGANGADGEDGVDGSDGLDVLIRIEDLPAGSECSNGGIEILVGYDRDGDGYLDDGEVTDRGVVCDGAAGSGDGGSTDGGSTDGGFTDGGSTDGGSTDGGSADGGATDGGGTDGGGSGLSTTVEFPSSDSTTHTGAALGAGGGGVYYVDGNYLTETFTSTGLGSISSLSLTFTMNDSTSSYCTVGELTWGVYVNGTEVGTYGYTGGAGLGTVSFDKVYSFSSVSGAGSDGETYTLRLEANETVCPGGGSWNWYPGGVAILGE